MLILRTQLNVYFDYKIWCANNMPIILESEWNIFVGRGQNNFQM